jgi:predicted lipoprotein
LAFFDLSKARGAGAAGLAVALLVPLLVYACDDSTSSPPLDYTALLQGLTDDTTVPATASFATEADALVTSLQSLETANDAASLTAAQSAWRAARKAYRLLDAEHYGPVTEQLTSDRVDTFPVDPAAIAALAAQPAPAVAAAPNDAKGFLALESLLFSADGDAAALTALADPKTRALARLLGEDIAAAAHALADAWTTGGFATQLKTAGSGSTRYATQRAALDDLVGAVGYALELVVAVDLANPLGRKNAGRPDQTQVIAALSDNSVADMAATLDGISAAYEGRGFTSLVRTRSAPLDDTFRSQLATCKSKLTALTPPFSRAIVNQTTVVLDAYEACKTAKTTWNNEVTSALGATVKPADTDGD